MHDNDLCSEEEEQWVIWNDAYGICDTVTIARVEIGSDSRKAWLDEPYDMVGPFSLDELERGGRISFAACVVMSHQRWQEDQVALRRASLEKRREAQGRLFEELERANGRRRRRPNRFQQCNEKQHRELLELPADGTLEPSKIKAAFRRLAKKVHPDVGGSHDHFVQITEARDALLELVS
ncbi:J domain-containing protein [Sulfurimonas sp. HSL3-7]|uniref:J domain-containing protein n=1 Tax=Sulfonitrofixus jiaomeiensis TaxID=3131938 RepID=UPI0031F74D06